MVDGFKCTCIGLNASLWLKNKALDFKLSVSESTGEIFPQRKEAKINALTFAISPRKNGGSSCAMYGSLHKFKNGGVQNWDDFALSDLSETLDKLADDYNINLDTAELHSIEIGVNIALNYQPKRIFESAICHKGKGFTNLDRKDRYLGVICEHTDYAIKLYDKTRQSKIKGLGYILRYEVKFYRIRTLETCGICRLSDLKNRECWEKVLPVLLSKLKEIVFFDFSLNTDELTDGQKLRWERFGNTKYWENLNRNQYYKARILHAELSRKYGAKDGAELLAEKVSNKYKELCQCNQEKRRQFPQVPEEVVSEKVATISNLEYVLENVAYGSENIPHGNKEEIHAKPRHCLSCGKNITAQRSGSLFCSEKLYGKEAKKCRNKDSNRRMIIKRKIKIAMEKELMLQVTYTDADGIEYTDILGTNEINPTREWLDRVKSVRALSNPAKTIEGITAQEYLLTISKQSEL